MGKIFQLAGKALVGLGCIAIALGVLDCVGAVILSIPAIGATSYVALATFVGLAMGFGGLCGILAGGELKYLATLHS